MSDVAGRIALVTGGASGIGRALATALAANGAQVLIADRDPRVTEVAEGVAVETGGRIEGLALDVTNEREVEGTMGEVVRRFGRLEILANVAGIYRRRPLLEMSPADWDETIGVNLRGVFLCTRYAAPFMVEQRFGRIVNIASGLAVRGQPRTAHYAASKGGVMAFTTAVARELEADNVTINCIAPGFTDTPATRAAHTEQELAAAIARTGRPLGQPEEIAGTFLFLVGEAARTITGSTLWMRQPGT